MDRCFLCFTRCRSGTRESSMRRAPQGLEARRLEDLRRDLQRSQLYYVDSLILSTSRLTGCLTVPTYVGTLRFAKKLRNCDDCSMFLVCHVFHVFYLFFSSREIDSTYVSDTKQRKQGRTGRKHPMKYTRYYSSGVLHCTERKPNNIRKEMLNLF